MIFSTVWVGGGISRMPRTANPATAATTPNTTIAVNIRPSALLGLLRFRPICKSSDLPDESLGRVPVTNGADYLRAPRLAVRLRCLGEKY